MGVWIVLSSVVAVKTSFVNFSCDRKRFVIGWEEEDQLEWLKSPPVIWAQFGCRSC